MFSTDRGHGQMLMHPSEPFAMMEMDRRWKPNIEIAPNCPRCASANTKFCYYNNYSLSQPRYFCKGCRRYWTKGGSLRNVPVGGGCRKSRRGRSARNGQSQRVSGNGFNAKGSADLNGESSLLAEEANETTEIDLAAVFARFLNQNPSSVEEFDSEPHGSSSNFSNSLTPESVENEISDTVLDYSQKPQPDPNVLMEYDLPVQEFLQDERIHNFVGSDDGLYTIDQLQDFVGGDDQLVQDVLWYESDTAASPPGNFIWQASPPIQQLPAPMMQLQQEMEYSLPINHEDEYYNSHIQYSTMSLSNDNWGSFDLSTF